LRAFFYLGFVNTTEWPQPEDDNGKVWKYMDLAKLLHTLDTGTLFMCRLDLLPDPHEGAVTQAMQKNRERLAIESGDATLAQHMSNFTKMTRQYMYVSCWRMDDDESEAMWKLYCPNNEGVAVQTTYRRLADSVDDNELEIGKITYVQPLTFATPEGFSTVAQIKRRAYAFEQEVRLYLFRYMPPGYDLTLGFPLPWTLNCIERVYVNPYAQQWYFDLIKRTLRRFGHGDIPVEWSSMKSEPIY
jgi:hypothetical protein